ncbi:MAG TPA: hypothetical protein VHZ04_00105 [Candidatus Paceibacterota bacterium]|jgi:hypothetical protein|nr:hypothetical protein [Candidatus Paceibacterota bacterium]
MKDGDQGTNHKGLSPVELLLIIMIAGAIVICGIYLYTRFH